MRHASRPASCSVLANTVRDFEAVRELFATSTLTVLGDLPFMFPYLGVIALQTKLSHEALDKIMQAPTDEAPVSLQAPPMTGWLEFRDVSFAYPNQPPVLEALNLRIYPGERVRIIGKLGSGKSTMLRLILNQYAPAPAACWSTASSTPSSSR